MNQESIAEIVKLIDLQRTKRGFLSIIQLLSLNNETNIILDPFSTLISENVILGHDNILYPNIIIETQNNGNISIGNSNIFCPGTILLADQGKISIGNKNEFGDGGLRVKSNMPNSLITFGDDGRYMNGPEIMGRCSFGSGTQILGAITVQNCNLGAGDNYKGVDPDKRGGLLKGFGLARNLEIKQGELINGLGTFDQSQVQHQSFYHPQKA